MNFTREELRELFIYDENVDSCLIWRRNGKRAGCLDGYWRVMVKTIKCQVNEIIHQYHFDDLNEGDIVRNIQGTSPKIDNLIVYRKNYTDKIKEFKYNKCWSELFIYSEGELYWKVENISGKYPSMRINSKIGDKLHNYINSEGYRMVTIAHKSATQYTHHRIIWEIMKGEIPEGFYIDHINGIRTDNKIENLRLVTREGNARNNGMQSNNSSGVKGVHYCCDGNYVAHVSINGKKKCRKFSIKKYGDKEAFKMAVECRSHMIEELNSREGEIKYTERHEGEHI